MLKNFIFDIDGTLIDTINMYMPALQTTLEKHGYHRNYSDLTKLFGITAIDALRGAEVAEADIQPIFKEWFDLAYQHTDQVKVFPGIESMLEKLAQTPDINLIVATSKTTDEYQNEFAKSFSIAKYFDHYVTADDTQKHKPDPDPVLAGIAKGNGDASESIYIGDTINDLKAATAAGAHFGAAIWGSAQPENLVNAEFLLNTPDDLLKLI